MVVGQQDESHIVKPGPIYATRAELLRLSELITELIDKHAELSGRVNLLELESGEKTLTRPADLLKEKILVFLKSMPNVKMTTGAIAANVCSESRFVSSRCKTLANNGTLKMDKIEGYATVYWYEEKEL